MRAAKPSQTSPAATPFVKVRGPSRPAHISAALIQRIVTVAACPALGFES